jgi:hypothetical protein
MHAPCSKRPARGRAGQYARPQALATVYMYVSPLSRLVCVCVRMYRAGQYARPQASSLPYICVPTQDLYAYADAYASACIAGQYARPQALATVYIYVSPLSRLVCVCVCVCVRMYRAGQYARPQALATAYIYVSPLSRLLCVCVRMYRAGQYARPQARMYACSRVLLRPVVLYTICCSSVAALL